MSSPYRLHYTSQDVGADTWSVYVEQYAARDDSEPIDGSQEHVSTWPNEQAADAEASRLQAAYLSRLVWR